MAAECQFHSPVLELLSEHPVPVFLDNVWMKAGAQASATAATCQQAFSKLLFSKGKQEPSMNGSFPYPDTAAFIEFTL